MVKRACAPSWAPAWLQPQDYFARNDLEKQLEMDCLKEELKRESEWMHLLKQIIQIMLATAKKDPSVVQIQNCRHRPGGLGRRDVGRFS